MSSGERAAAEDFSPQSGPAPAGTDAQAESCLPSGLFESCDPSVVDELAGSVAQVFLRHMATECAPPIEVGKLEQDNTRNLVSDEEIVAFLTERSSGPRTEAPDLDADLAGERLFILADLATHGSGLARQKATTELREFVNGLWRDKRIESGLLRELVELIDHARQRAGVSVLLQVLLMAATKAMETSEARG